MLPGLGFSEVLVLGVIALLVVGPKDLPLLLRKLGKYTARMRALANEFRSGFDELARQAELEELRKEMDALKRDQQDALHRFDADVMRPLNAPLNAPLTEPTAEPTAGPMTDPAAAVVPAVEPGVEAAPDVSGHAVETMPEQTTAKAAS